MLRMKAIDGGLLKKDRNSGNEKKVRTVRFLPNPKLKGQKEEELKGKNTIVSFAPLAPLYSFVFRLFSFQRPVGRRMPDGFHFLVELFHHFGILVRQIMPFLHILLDVIQL